MGYRSEVAIALSKSDMDRLFEEAEEASSASDPCSPSALLGYGTRCDVETDEGPWSILHFDWIKWYSGCGEKDIDLVMGFLETCDAYHFLRIGEEDGDIEDEAFNMPVDLMHPYTEAHIEFDC